MKKPLPMYRLTRFDFEGMLFANFPVEAWVSGAAERAVVDTVRDHFGAEAHLDAATVYTAITTIENARIDILKPWEVEAHRLTVRPELTKRFPPYWEQNGGRHRLGEVIGWDFDAADEQKICTNDAGGWDFDAEPETSRGKSAPSVSSGWDF